MNSKLFAWGLFVSIYLYAGGERIPTSINQADTDNLSTILTDQTIDQTTNQIDSTQHQNLIGSTSGPLVIHANDHEADHLVPRHYINGIKLSPLYNLFACFLPYCFLQKQEVEERDINWCTFRADSTKHIVANMVMRRDKNKESQKPN